MNKILVVHLDKNGKAIDKGFEADLAKYKEVNKGNFNWDQVLTSFLNGESYTTLNQPYGNITLSVIGKYWQAQDQTDADYIGILEFQSNNMEWHNFEVVRNDTHFIFGGVCNIGLIESGNFEIDNCLSIDENLSQLISDLESFYNDGKGYQSEPFSCNDRM